MTCIYCSRSKFGILSPKLRDSKKHRVVRCRACGLVQLSPTPKPEDDKEFYDAGRQFANIGEPTALKTLRRNQQADTARRVKLVGRLLKPRARVLDVGSGFGFFLEAAKKRGLRPEGIEVSRFARAISKKISRAKVHDLDLFQASLDKKFDCVTLFHVLEHISQPIAFLRQVKPLLKKSGKLIIEVPNLSDALLSVSPPYRKFYWQRAHIAYYDPKSLIKILRRAGFKIRNRIFVQRYSLDNMMHWLIKGGPQLQKPSFQTVNYAWLEEFYKRELIKRKQTDTLTIIAKQP